MAIIIIRRKSIVEEVTIGQVHVLAAAEIASVLGLVLAVVEVKNSNLVLVLDPVCPLRDRLVPGLASLILPCLSLVKFVNG